MEKGYYNSPLGILEIVCDNDVLISLKLVEKASEKNSEATFIKKIKTQLDEYFSGSRKTFDIKMNPEGTDFQKRVWNELTKIPYGKTKSYCEIAQNLGNKNAQRAVGNACNKNKIMIMIPCHRVIFKNGQIGGFAFGAAVKQKLMETESRYI